MTPWKFHGYGTGSPEVTVILERITHWFPIDYNGRPGTEIELDTGKSIRVGHYSDDVEKALKSVPQGRS